MLDSSLRSSTLGTYAVLLWEYIKIKLITFQLCLTICSLSFYSFLVLNRSMFNVSREVKLQAISGKS